MPTYCYRVGDRIIEWQARMNAIPSALLVNGQVAERDIVAEHGGQRSGNPWVKHSSLALSVHPLDVKKYRKDAHKRGVGKNVTIRDDGMFEFRSHDDQKKYGRAYGYVNYGDYY